MFYIKQAISKAAVARRSTKWDNYLDKLPESKSEVQPVIDRNIQGGSYQIIKLLPENNGEFEYRIKGMNEPHERVVRESELQRS
jgi:hypothetical protein